jgi:hypothetical protein
MGDCSCQCDCEFITQIREDERNKDLDYHYVAAQAEAEGQRIMFAKCFAVVEKFDDVDEIELIIADLRALSANADIDLNVSERRQEKPCQSYLNGQRDMLAKCITALEVEMEGETQDRVDGLWDAIVALRALQEKP